MAEYNRLVGENGNRVLKDVELAQAVYNSKPQVQSKTLV